MMKIKSKILVTGADGFIGQQLCSALEEIGVPVVRITRKGFGTLSGATDWGAVLEGVDTVIHLAGRAHVLDTEGAAGEKNLDVEMTERLALDAIQAGVSLMIYISSVKANGEGAPTPYTEDSPLHPEDEYGLRKKKVECMLQKISLGGGLNVIVLRPPLVYGLGVKANFERLMRLVGRAWLLPFGRFRAKRSYIYVKNLCSAIIKVYQKRPQGFQPYLISDGDDLNLAELTSLIAAGQGKRIFLLPVPPLFLRFALALVRRSGVYRRLNGVLRIDSSRFCKEMDWTPPYSVCDAFSDMRDTDSGPVSGMKASG